MDPFTMPNQKDFRALFKSGVILPGVKYSQTDLKLAVSNLKNARIKKIISQTSNLNNLVWPSNSSDSDLSPKTAAKNVCNSTREDRNKTEIINSTLIAPKSCDSIHFKPNLNNFASNLEPTKDKLSYVTEDILRNLLVCDKMSDVRLTKDSDVFNSENTSKEPSARKRCGKRKINSILERNQELSLNDNTEKDRPIFESSLNGNKSVLIGKTFRVEKPSSATIQIEKMAPVKKVSSSGTAKSNFKGTTKKDNSQRIVKKRLGNSRRKVNVESVSETSNSISNHVITTEDIVIETPSSGLMSSHDSKNSVQNNKQLPKSVEESCERVASKKVPELSNNKRRKRTTSNLSHEEVKLLPLVYVNRISQEDLFNINNSDCNNNTKNQNDSQSKTFPKPKSRKTITRKCNQSNLLAINSNLIDNKQQQTNSQSVEYEFNINNNCENDLESLKNVIFEENRNIMSPLSENETKSSCHLRSTERTDLHNKTNDKSGNENGFVSNLNVSNRFESCRKDSKSIKETATSSSTSYKSQETGSNSILVSIPTSKIFRNKRPFRYICSQDSRLNVLTKKPLICETDKNNLDRESDECSKVTVDITKSIQNVSSSASSGSPRDSFTYKINYQDNLELSDSNDSNNLVIDIDETFSTLENDTLIERDSTESCELNSKIEKCKKMVVQSIPEISGKCIKRKKLRKSEISEIMMGEKTTNFEKCTVEKIPKTIEENIEFESSPSKCSSTNTTVEKCRSKRQSLIRSKSSSSERQTSTKEDQSLTKSSTKNQQTLTKSSSGKTQRSTKDDQSLTGNKAIKNTNSKSNVDQEGTSRTRERQRKTTQKCSVEIKKKSEKELVSSVAITGTTENPQENTVQLRKSRFFQSKLNFAASISEETCSSSSEINNKTTETKTNNKTLETIKTSNKLPETIKTSKKTRETAKTNNQKPETTKSSNQILEAIKISNLPPEIINKIPKTIKSGNQTPETINKLSETIKSGNQTPEIVKTNNKTLETINTSNQTPDTIKTSKQTSETSKKTPPKTFKTKNRRPKSRKASTKTSETSNTIYKTAESTKTSETSNTIYKTAESIKTSETGNTIYKTAESTKTTLECVDSGSTSKICNTPSSNSSKESSNNELSGTFNSCSESVSSRHSSLSSSSSSSSSAASGSSDIVVNTLPESTSTQSDHDESREDTELIKLRNQFESCGLVLDDFCRKFPMNIRLNDKILLLRKPHVCGNNSHTSTTLITAKVDEET